MIDGEELVAIEEPSVFNPPRKKMVCLHGEFMVPEDWKIDIESIQLLRYIAEAPDPALKKLWEHIGFARWFTDFCSYLDTYVRQAGFGPEGVFSIGGFLRAGGKESISPYLKTLLNNTLTAGNLSSDYSPWLIELLNRKPVTQV